MRACVEFVGVGYQEIETTVCQWFNDKGVINVDSVHGGKYAYDCVTLYACSVVHGPNSIDSLRNVITASGRDDTSSCQLIELGREFPPSDVGGRCRSRSGVAVDSIDFTLVLRVVLARNPTTVHSAAVSFTQRDQTRPTRGVQHRKSRRNFVVAPLGASQAGSRHGSPGDGSRFRLQRSSVNCYVWGTKTMISIITVCT